MAAGTSTIREFFARLGFDVDKGSLGAADRQMQAIKSGLQGIAGILVAGKVTQALIGAVKGTAELGDEIKAAAARVGVTTDALQELRFAGELANVSAEGLQNGLRVLSRNAFEAATGGKEAQQNFSDLGLSVRDASGKLKPAEQLFGELADRIKGTTNETQKVALAQKILGRGGTELLPLLNQGSAAIAAQRREAHALGGVLSGDLIEAGDEFTDQQARLKLSIQGIKNALTKAMLPAINHTLVAMTKWIATNSKWLGRGIADAVSKLGRVIFAMGEAIAYVVKTNADFISQLSPMAKGLLAVAAGAAILAVIFASPVASMILFLALLGLIVEDFKVFGEGGDSVIGRFMVSMDKLLAQWGAFGRAVLFVGRVLRAVFNLANNLLFSLGERFFGMVSGDFLTGGAALQRQMGTLADDFMRDIQPRFVTGNAMAQGAVMNAPISASITVNLPGGAMGGSEAQNIAVGVRRAVEEVLDNHLRATKKSFDRAASAGFAQVAELP